MNRETLTRVYFVAQKGVRSPRGLWIFVALVLFGATACKRKSSTGTAEVDRHLTIIATGDIHGVVEPCGCTSDILGDVSRVKQLAQNALWVDAGNLFYDADTYKGERVFQAEVRARCLASVLANAEVGLGPSDLAGPIPDGAQLLAANLVAPFVKPPTVREIDGVRVGVFGVIAPGTYGKLTATDAHVAAVAAIGQLRAANVDVIIALLGMGRGAARTLIGAAPGIDLAVYSVEVGDGIAEPEPVASGAHPTWLFASADEAKRVVRLELTLPHHGGPLQWRRTDDDKQIAQQRTLARLAKQRKRLAELQQTKDADPAFVQTIKDEIAALEAETQPANAAAATTTKPVPKTSAFTYALVPVRRTLARDSDALAAMKNADQVIGAANRKAAEAQPPPAPEAGKATYVGQAACAGCHAEAAAFWKTTHHANAWNELVTVGKQYDYDCIGCHVTGWQKPGGSHLASVESKLLTNVQCEVCHGPGSQHVAATPDKKLATIKSSPDAKLCRSTCHLPEHSDTFEYEAYLRDITGAGHAAALRKGLGDGPTAHSLRKAAMDKVAANAAATGAPPPPTP